MTTHHHNPELDRIELGDRVVRYCDDYYPPVGLFIASLLETARDGAN